MSIYPYSVNGEISIFNTTTKVFEAELSVNNTPVHFSGKITEDEGTFEWEKRVAVTEGGFSVSGEELLKLKKMNFKYGAHGIESSGGITTKIEFLDSENKVIGSIIGHPHEAYANNDGKGNGAWKKGG